MISPADPRQLTRRADILDAMADNIVSARQRGETGLIDLTEHGWSPAQVRRYGSHAREMAEIRLAVQPPSAVTRLDDYGHRPTPRTGDMRAMLDDFGGAA